MARFMDIHTGMKGITLQQLTEAHRKDAEAQGNEHVRFMQAWADPVTGKVFCLSEGPDKGAVRRVHEKAGHAVDEIYEIPLTVG
jgi:Nickel responsive protein SCO4226-like